MAFENLAIRRVVLHEVYKRRLDGAPVPPRLGTQLIGLDGDGLDVFRERVVDAMGSTSQSMEMDIAEAEPGSALAIASALLGMADADFITESAKFADKLTASQISRSLPGGKLVVFNGTVNAASTPYVAVIKAEKQGGFREGRDALQFLNDLFLTPASKLYKIGFFVREAAADRLPDGWKASVYDSHMTTANRDAAAKYFYENFLGCRIARNNANLTRVFFNETRNFIGQLAIEPEDKDDLFTSLYTYLKVDQTPTIQVNAFSTTYIPNDKQDDYRNFMRDKGFPVTAVHKDTTEIKGKLRKRRVRFPGSIELTAPPESFKDLISLETVRSDDPRPGQPALWTRVTIKARIRDQE